MEFLVRRIVITVNLLPETMLSTYANATRAGDFVARFCSSCIFYGRLFVLAWKTCRGDCTRVYAISVRCADLATVAREVCSEIDELKYLFL